MDIFPDIETIQADWQRQEDHPATEPCPRCGSTRNHGCNIKQIIADNAQALAEDIDRCAFEFAFGDLLRKH